MITNVNSESQIVLEVKELRTEFNTKEGIVHAVNGISYTLRKGETLGIVGESGCGKSVSVLSLMRLLPKPAGRIAGGKIIFMGKDLLELTKEDMEDLRGREIAMIFQDPMTSLNPVRTIGYQLEEPIILHLGLNKKQAQARAIELLNMVGIPAASQRLNDYPHQFSGGMRQRVMIAMALSCNPKLLIADEPTTALDVTIQAQIVELVKDLRSKLDMSLIWITHDLSLIAGLADKVIVMYAGRIIEEAGIDDLYENPRHPYTSSLLKSLPDMDGPPGEKLDTIEGLPPDLLEIVPGCPFVPRCKFARDKCVQENPRLENVSNEHKLACLVDIGTGELR